MTNTHDKTVLAFDYGERRIGVAKSDPTGLIASALETIETKSSGEAIKRIEYLLLTYHPNAVVVGYPLLASGDRSAKCDAVDRFIGRIQRLFTGPVYKVDEYDSSLEAAAIVHAHGKRIGKDKKRIDRLAAVVILQRYLDGLYER
ncbi:MAG: Holliday junction resolvase RuvX [Candidatus Zixiibacteriota bacterium]